MLNQLSPPPRQDKDITGHTWQEWFRQLREWIVANYPSDYFFEVARGNIANTTSEHILSKSDLNTAGTESDIWYSATSQKTWRTTAATLECISTSANDTAAGTGAQTVRIEGLDASFNKISETVTMAGLVATTATTQSFIRVNSATVITSGAYASGATTGTNIGNITVRVSGAGATETVIEAAKGIDFGSHYTIPSGYTGYINRVSLSVDSGKTAATVRMYMRQNANDVTTPFTAKIYVHGWPGCSGNFQEDTKEHYTLPAKSDIWFTCVPGANNTNIHVDYDLILVRTA